MLKKLLNESFGDYIVRLRQAKGYSQRKLAQVTGISNTTISRIENNITTNPDLNTLKLLAKYLDIDEIYMLEASGYKEDTQSPNLTDKEKKDIAKQVEDMLNNIDKVDGLEFYNQPQDEEDMDYIRRGLQRFLEDVKIYNKVKYNPKKNKK